MASTPEVETKKLFEQETFFNDKYFKVVFAMFVVFAITAALFALNFLYLTTLSPPPIYFQASEQGAIIQEVPLDKANMESNALLNWVTEAMMLGNTFNFMNYHMVMDRATPYFTKDGYDSYLNALTNAKVTDQVIQKKLVLKTIPVDAPQVLLEKAFSGRYMWKVKMPLKFRYQNYTTDRFELLDATLIVMRVPTTESSNGVLILKYDLSPSEQR